MSHDRTNTSFTPWLHIVTRRELDLDVLEDRDEVLLAKYYEWGLDTDLAARVLRSVWKDREEDINS